MSLQALLQDPHVNVPQLFQQPDILNQMKSKISKFVGFCKKNEQFTNIMITLGIKTPMHRHENIEMRKVSHVASDFLTCDNDTIADLFVIEETQPRIRCYSEDDDEVLEQIISNQTTGEQLIIQRSPSKQQKVQTQFQKKYVHLLDLLKYLSEPNPDENCINYLIKVLNTVIRVKPEQVFAFFSQKPQIMKRMVELTNFPSISYSIAKIINESQDKKYRQFKVKIVQMVVKEILCKIGCEGFGVYAQFIEEVFQKNRHRCQQQDQIKIATQCLVEKQVINAMLSGVLSNQSTSKTSNCLLYLLKVAQRMNVDQQQDPYSYNQPQTNKPTMDFQVDKLYQSFNKLVELAPIFNRQNYSPAQILIFYDLLLAMSRNSRFKAAQIDKNNCILALIKVINASEKGKNGIIKNKIILLIQNIHNLESIGNDKEKQSIDQSAEISRKIIQEIENMDQSNRQALCYKQKLILLLTSNYDQSLHEVHWKYANVLAPTNYTENRNFKVKELQFVKTYARNKDKAQKEKQGAQTEKNGQTTGSSSNQSQQNEDVQQTNTNGLESTSNNAPNSIGINLNILNSKISAIKSKKHNSKSEQLHEGDTQSKTDTQAKQEGEQTKDEKKQTKKKDIEEKQKNEQMVKGQNTEKPAKDDKLEQQNEQIPRIVVHQKNKKESININIGFYVRYLTLF